MFGEQDGAVDDGTVVGRAVAIMDVVAESGEPVQLAELARATGIPKPTVYRIANDLASRGMLERTEGGYRTGQRLLDHGLQAVNQRKYATVLQPVLLDLHRRSRGEVAWFGVFVNGDFKGVSMLYGPERADRVRRLDFPTLAALGPSVVLTASGRLQVALRPDLAEQIRERGCRPLTRYSIVEPKRLRSSLDESADTGFAFEQEQAFLGSNCAAARVSDRDGVPVGVLGVTSLRSGSDARALRTGLLAAAAALGDDLSA